MGRALFRVRQTVQLWSSSLAIRLRRGRVGALTETSLPQRSLDDSSPTPRPRRSRRRGPARAARIGRRAHAGQPEAVRDGRLGRRAELVPDQSDDASGSAVTPPRPRRRTTSPCTIRVAPQLPPLRAAASTRPRTSRDGDTTWTVTFVDGKYPFQCDAHTTTMKGTFPSAPRRLRRRRKPVALAARVGPGKAISVRRSSGAKVVTIKAGKAKITVRDLTKGQLPSGRPGREREDGRRVQGHEDVGADAPEGRLPLPLGRAPEAQGLLPRHLTVGRASRGRPG